MTYEIINHELYKNARELEERRAYNRQKKRDSRERGRGTSEIPIFDLSKKSETTADPLDSSSVSPSGSDREGVQGEGGPHKRLGDWVIPPELYAEAERDHGLSRRTLEHRVKALRNRKIPGDGVWDRTEYVRGLLSEWATWGEPKPRRLSAAAPRLLEPNEAQRRHASKHGVDLGAIVASLEQRGVVEALGLGRARELISSELAKAVQARARAAPTAA